MLCALHYKKDTYQDTLHRSTQGVDRGRKKFHTDIPLQTEGLFCPYTILIYVCLQLM